MDYKAEAEKIINEVKKDPAKVQEYLKDGEAFLKKTVGDKFSTEEIQKIAAEVETKLGAEGGDLLKKFSSGEGADVLKGVENLFGKK